MVVVVVPSPVSGSVVVVVVSEVVVDSSGAAAGSCWTKKYVKPTIPTMMSGRIQRPGFGSGFRLVIGTTTLAGRFSVPEHGDEPLVLRL